MTSADLPETMQQTARATRLFITGAAGFVGINMVKHAATAGAQVIALTRREPDSASQTFLADVADKVTWCVGDVSDAAGLCELVSRHDVTHILHAAALTGSLETEKHDARRMLDVNLLGTLNLLEAAREVRATRTVFVSSSGLYGANPAQPALTEASPLQIAGLYTIAKQASEHLCNRFAELHKLDIITGRLGTAYGPMERPTRSRQRMSAVYHAVTAALNKQPLTVIGAAIARDFCHIDDVSQAYMHLLFANQLNHTCYNVAGAHAEPLSHALNALTDMYGLVWRTDTRDDTTREHLVQMPEQARASLDLSRLQADTGWTPRFDLMAGVRAYAAWRQSNLDKDLQDVNESA